MKLKIPLHIIDLDEGNYHILVSAILPDGTGSFWAVDTGASKTVFDKSLVSRCGIEEIEGDFQTAGIGEIPIRVNCAILPKVGIGKLMVSKFEVAVIDLSNINTLYQKTANIQICGLLGSDFLLGKNAFIDFKRKVLILNE